MRGSVRMMMMIVYLNINKIYLKFRNKLFNIYQIKYSCKSWSYFIISVKFTIAMR